MNIQALILSIGATVILFFIGREDWTMLIPIPLAILNGYINTRYWKRKQIGKRFHNLQLIILVSLAAILVATKVILWDELTLVVALYYATFEISINKLNNQVWNYTGKSSELDRFFRRLTKHNEGKSRTLFIVIKLLFLFAGMSIYLANKPL